MTSAEETVRSRANPLFKRLRALKERGPRDGVCLLEGAKLMREALAAGVPIVEVAITPEAEGRPELEDALATLAERGVPVRRLAAGLLASLSETEATQGVVVLARPPDFEEEDLFATAPPLVVVAAGIQDPGNLGGLLRTAEAAGATGCYLTAGCADPYSWKALRGSMGSALRLPVVRGLDVAEVMGRLEARGVPVLATASGGETRYDTADLTGPVALVFGREGTGLSPEAERAAAARLRIPLARGVESLNVGVAAGLVLFEAARQRGFASAADPGAGGGT